MIVGSVPANFAVTLSKWFAVEAPPMMSGVDREVTSAATWAGVQVGWSCSTWAAAAVTSGAEKEVPDPVIGMWGVAMLAM